MAEQMHVRPVWQMAYDIFDLFSASLGRSSIHILDVGSCPLIIGSICPLFSLLSILLLPHRIFTLQ
jgi:hypothetical protein